MANYFKKIADNEFFQNFILFLILLTAVSMGLETVPELVDAYGTLFLMISYVTQIVFTFEIAVRIFAYAPHYPSFFKEGWNLFDFSIVVLSYVPGVGSLFYIARLLRVLRLLRMISVSDQLRTFVDQLREAFDEIAYTGVITMILAYIFMIIGHYLFGEIAAEHWGSLARAGLTVFYLLLLQNVQDYVVAVTQNNQFYVIYFLVFYFVFVSLLISMMVAAVVNGVKGKYGHH